MAGGAHRALTTSVSLREYIEARLTDKDIRDQQRYEAAQTALQAALLAAEKAVATALLAAEKAVTKAEAASEKRLSTVTEQIRILTARVDTASGRTGGASALYGYLMAGAGVILAIVAFVTR